MTIRKLDAALKVATADNHITQAEMETLKAAVGRFASGKEKAAMGHLAARIQSGALSSDAPIFELETRREFLWAKLSGASTAGAKAAEGSASIKGMVVGFFTKFVPSIVGALIATLQD